MKIDWKPEAIKAFKDALPMFVFSGDESVCAALSAAVKAQGLFIHPDGIEIAKAQARAEAFEEAAKAAIDFPAFEHGGLSCDPHYAARQASLEIAAAIREMAKHPPKGETQ